MPLMWIGRLSSSRFRLRADKVVPKLIPVLLILGATLSAAAVAFGCVPAIADHTGGVAFIRVMYRLQWLFVGTTVVCALALVGMVITNHRRGIWLVGLLPVVGLFGWRFGISPARPGYVDDAPAFVQTVNPDWLDGGAAVLGIVSGEQAYAIPLAAMEQAPVLVHTERDHRVIVMWSAQAGIATACRTDRTLRGRDLRIVASPAGVLLLFNERVGEFFDALTLAQRGGTPLSGFQTRLPVDVATWDAWRALHIDTQLLDPRRAMPTAPLPEPRETEAVVFIASNPPIVVPREELSVEPMNVTNGTTSALLFRDSAGRLHAFERKVDGDLFLRFEPSLDKHRKNVAFIDTDTQSGWTTSGTCIDGTLAGRRLPRLVVLDAVPATAARYWLR